MQLDKIVERIESAFGEELAIPQEKLRKGDIETLARVFGDEGFQAFLQDQISRQIIRDYLTNAVMLGFVGESDLDTIDALVASPQSRAAMSLYMLMSSVEDAAELLARGAPPELTPLQAETDNPPHIHLVRS